MKLKMTLKVRRKKCSETAKVRCKKCIKTRKTRDFSRVAFGGDGGIRTHVPLLTAN